MPSLLGKHLVRDHGWSAGEVSACLHAGLSLDTQHKRDHRLRDCGHSLEQATLPLIETKTEKSAKQQLLEEALEIITGDRQRLYGKPSQNFIDTAEIMSAYLHARGLLPRDVWLEAYDAAILVDCLKTARIATSPTEPDHWRDKIGYAGCGWECVVELLVGAADRKGDNG